MACIIHKSNKNAKQRDSRKHVDHNLKKTPQYLGVPATVTKQQFGIHSQAEAKKVFSEKKELLEQKK
ncbi:MAG: hypothetical protein JWQ35_2785 [Bacteriovoracaceae bacterium]|nr:hypothetical protein [Bacteriovoracaceae bacterium]